MTTSLVAQKSLRFVVIPKVAHPWFDEVVNGAMAQARSLEGQLAIKIDIDYQPPQVADVSVQDAILAAMAATDPDGIAIDPLESLADLPAMALVKNKSIPLIVFDSPSDAEGICSVGNDFTEQGVIAAERLVGLIGGAGKVAVMQGFPTAPNHRERFEAQLAVLRRYPDITIVDGGIDNDDIDTARQQAAAVLVAHPDLVGYLCCDAAGPIGIAAAIRDAGLVGKITFVSMDGIAPILDAIAEGIIEASSATRPRMQGAMIVAALWLATLGVELPRRIDTGIDVITSQNLDHFRTAAAEAS